MSSRPPTRTYRPVQSCSRPYSAMCAILILCFTAANTTLQAANALETEAASTSRPQLNDAFLAKQQTLAADYKTHEKTWLSISYPDGSEPSQALALIQAPRSAQVQGAILLLPATGQHPDWPTVIQPLRTSLPDAGWYTLALMLPQHIPATLPERNRTTKQRETVLLDSKLQQALANGSRRTPSSDNSPTTNQTTLEPNDDDGPDNTTSPNDTSAASNTAENDKGNTTDSQGESVDINLTNNKPEAPLPYLTRALAHISSALDYLAAAGYQNVIVVASGESAELALSHIKPLAADMSSQGFGLVMIDAKLGEELAHDIGTALGSQFQAPILDIVDGSNPELTSKALTRLKAARVANTANYQQVVLPTINRHSEQKTLLKRVRYWLQQHTPGMTSR